MNGRDNGLRILHIGTQDRIVHNGMTLAVIDCTPNDVAAQMPSAAAIERCKQLGVLYDRLYASKPAPSQLMVNELTHIIRRDDGLLGVPTLQALWRRGVIKPAVRVAHDSGRSYRDWEPVY